MTPLQIALAVVGVVLVVGIIAAVYSSKPAASSAVTPSTAGSTGSTSSGSTGSTGAGSTGSTGAAPVATVTKTWKVYPKMNFVQNQISGPGKGSADGNIKYLGTYGAVDGCATKCKSDTSCKAYTWVDSTNVNGYANQCWGMGSVPIRYTDAQVTSGELAEGFTPGDFVTAAKASAATFSNTLQRRMGMETAAGESFHSSAPFGLSEHFQLHGDVGVGSFWQGNQSPVW
jgi:hypothetical protein